VDFQQLHTRLVVVLRDRVRNGEYTERHLARMVAISQPHLHNVLKGKRLLSLERASQILHHLHMDLFDLLEDRDIEEWRLRH
jgi:hypothetical protein